MAQSVGADVVSSYGSFNIPGDHVGQVISAELFPGSVCVFHAKQGGGFWEVLWTDTAGQVVLYRFLGDAGEGAHTALIALAEPDVHKTVFKVKVTGTQFPEFGVSKPGCEEHSDNSKGSGEHLRGDSLGLDGG
mgnify:CR=1 FL=1